MRKQVWSRSQEVDFCNKINSVIEDNKINRVSASELEFISEKVVDKLQLPKKKLTAQIVRKTFDKNLIQHKQTLQSHSDRSKLWNVTGLK